MTINFTDAEREWIDKIPFAWKVKEGCPEEIRKTLQKKLDELYGKKYD